MSVASSEFPRDLKIAASASVHSDANHAFDRYQQTRFFLALDGLRAIAILGVIAFHAGVPTPTFFGSSGYLGVEFFFVISGFLITTLLLREQRDVGAVSLKKFYIRRTLRIFPLYYTVLLAYCVVTRLTDYHTADGQEFFHRLPIFATYTSNLFMPENGHFAISWSLSAEEQFYLFWPFLVCFLRKPWMPLAAILLLAVGDQAVETLVNLRTIDLGGAGNRILCSLQTPICLGCVMAYLLHWRRPFVALWGILGRPAFPAVMLLVALIVSVFIPLQRADLPPDHYMIGSEGCLLFDRAMTEQQVNFICGGLLLLMTFIACGIVGSCCAAGGGWARKLLTQRFVRHVGTISYCMYLTHQLCLKFAGVAISKLTHQPNTPTATYLVGVPMTICIATLSYRYYESIFLRLKDRLAKRPVKEKIDGRQGEDVSGTADFESPVVS